MDEGNITHLRHEKASLSGADGAQARVNETEPRGRQSPHGPCLQSPSLGRREARSVFSLAGASCMGWVLGEIRAVLLDKRDAHRYRRRSGGFADGSDGGAMEQGLSEVTQELLGFWA